MKMIEKNDKSVLYYQIVIILHNQDNRYLIRLEFLITIMR